MVNTHVRPVPEHAPLHPTKKDVLSGVAVSVTTTPGLKTIVQANPQLIPAGLEVTVPPPPPDLVTLRRRINVAVTVRAALMLTTQDPVPVHAPLHPLNTDDAFAGVAVRVIWVPALKIAEQVDPQLIPAGLEETVPAPKPALVTLRVYWIGVNVAVTN
jgi:hypothetical protein